VLWEGTQLREDGLIMSDHMPAQEDHGAQRDSEPDVSDTAEFARMRAVMRASEKHREGGVDPELEDPGADTSPGA
jgi:hypothetical protein